MFGWLKRQKNLCLRCSASLIQKETFKEQDGERIASFLCPSCDSHYIRRNAGDLHDGWGMPLSLVLYSVIFSEDPLPMAAWVAQRTADHMDPAKIAKIVEHIDEELAHPKQKVKEILTCAGTEADLRAYLRDLADRLRARLEEEGRRKNELAWRVRWKGGFPNRVDSLPQLDELLDRLVGEYQYGIGVLVEIESPKRNTLVIGLGHGLSVLTYIPASLDPPCFISKRAASAPRNAATFLRRGRHLKVPSDHLIPIGSARAAVSQFFETEEMPSSVEWLEEDSSAPLPKI